MSCSSSGSLNIKAGDVIATQTASKTSWLIRLATGSAWSHVGIATGENTILEAVKGPKPRCNTTPQVREIPIDEFLNGSSKILHCVRPKSLTSQEALKLKNFVSAISEKTYTSINAAATVAIPWLKVAYIIFGTSWIFAIQDKIFSPQFAYEYALGTLVVYLLLYFMYRVQIWSFRCQWGVKTTERLFKKIRFGAWLVEEKYNVFCSKLVLLADKEIGGEIHKKTPDANEVQPGHIVKACKKLGWEIGSGKCGRECVART